MGCVYKFDPKHTLLRIGECSQWRGNVAVTNKNRHTLPEVSQFELRAEESTNIWSRWLACAVARNKGWRIEATRFHDNINVSKDVHQANETGMI